MGVTVNDLVVYRYEKQLSDFKVGDLVHNFNGNDYRVMENYGGGDVLLMQMNTGMFVVAEDIEVYKRYPKDDMLTEENTKTGIEWGSGVCLGNDIAAINFKKLREEYGAPPEPNERGEHEVAKSEGTEKSELTENSTKDTDTDNTPDSGADAATKAVNEEAPTKTQEKSIEIVEDKKSQNLTGNPIKSQAKVSTKQRSSGKILRKERCSARLR